MKKKIGQTIFGLLILAVLMIAGWYIINWLFRSFLGLDKALASSIIAGFVALISLIFAYWKEREKSRQEAHREKKTEIYSIFFDIVFRILKETKNKNPTTPYAESQELQDSLYELMKGVLAYGSPEVVLSIGRWRLNSNASSNTILLHVGDILLAMRKDIGLSNKGLTNINIHQVYVLDDMEKLLKETQ
ncbi:hypothetical protein [Pseudochrobactrum sp. B5]|uniref:hypothetical protein n=1 Tax=Pseudochrobactrum sp. B5 TaxID=1289478 RepID=UPI000951D250|nr:hypothetical protein [Pseudochrobactrum sp. B5]